VPLEIIPHVKRVVSKGSEYLYFNTGKRNAKGHVIYAPLPPLKDPKFWPRHAALCAGRTKRANLAGELTVPGLVALYQKSPQWRQLAPASRKLYTAGLNRLSEDLPTAPAAQISSGDIRILFDGMGETPSMANAFLRTVGSLYKWGRPHHVAVNPIEGIEPFETGEHEPWPQALIDLAEVSADPFIRLSVRMMLYTAQRIGDVCVARWSDMNGGFWVMTPEKTKKHRGEMEIPIHRDLQAELARHSKVGPFLFVGRDGAMAPQTMRRAIQTWATGQGYDVVPHGLRKNAVNALLEVGCSVAETAAISGQSLQMVEFYAKKRNQTKLGSAAILKWEKRA
jgi:integrase